MVVVLIVVLVIKEEQEEEEEGAESMTSHHVQRNQRPLFSLAPHPSDGAVHLAAHSKDDVRIPWGGSWLAWRFQ